VPYNETERYYFKNGDEIYSDKIARFIIDCENNSKGLVTKRLADIYNEIYIDEFQDLSGWDLDLLEILLQVGIRMVIVGDPRQCTYTTNNSARNCQCCGMGMLDLICQWEANNLCCIEKLARSYRCNQQICDFADLLWPDMEKTVSHNHKTTDHDGIFIVSEDYIHEYVKTFFPKVLRYNKTANTYGYGAQNFGAVKGLEFERVLIIPHGPMKKYLHTGNLNDVRKSLELFYVAITRAKQSVAFLYDEKCGCGCIHWKPKLN
jgi:DNA helicase-2/ATP-dependent DNA helicase PcrA